jgi:hypothetical protein
MAVSRQERSECVLLPLELSHRCAHAEPQVIALGIHERCRYSARELIISSLTGSVLSPLFSNRLHMNNKTQTE